MIPFLIIFRRQRHPDFRNKSFVCHLLIVVLLSGIGYHLLFFESLKFTTPTRAALIIALNPFFTAIGERFINKTRRSIKFYTGFMISFGGAVWVIVSRGSGVNWNLLSGTGELMCLGASLCWSAYTIYSKKTKQPEWDSLWIGAYNYLLTALLILPWIITALQPKIWLNYLPDTWLGLWYMAVFPTAIGYTMFYIGVQKRGPAWASVFIYLVPSFTANLDYLFFDRAFTIPMVAGTTLVVTGLFIANISINQIKTLFVQK